VTARAFWIGAVVFLLLLHAGIQGVIVLASAQDPSFAVEPDYERKAAHWDDVMRERAASDRLGWSATLDTMATGNGRVAVTLGLADGGGAAVARARVRVAAFHVAFAGRILEADLIETAPGSYAATLPMQRPGLWEFRVEAERDREKFVRTLREKVACRP
jgi:hypothetical protein